ncbi:Sialic acid synthase (N-acetylneuraminic acid synthetase) [Flavobacterium indicum GPTSA100-9 = DSM 17447]|uniref:Sialic acid synthase (N-acetylneuraminic acid synthetase) n=1 Tax=Flavobacterium indicum (strain DSM 17447 / CIP 109464 / GPTSA100-9) TaxID=1094466 RepID=H8XUE1_FLAIG|nr:pseudaminic acid synthase [Flavobacterium indicum]CCG52924.1 Sialic acid synthase (N-acetylneuraminic acid synthetase) [Flavobacterium indicum GPTSA100-9 = DSM 17447]
MKINNFQINQNSPVFIIAELSANHNGSLETALETVRAAKRAGADCIKLQTYTADTITLDSNKPDFIINGTIWEGRKLHDLYQEAYTPWDWHQAIFDEAKKEGLICFSSPFDKSAVDFLEDLNTPAYKIASFEITDIPLIEYVASKGKPIIISTGIAEKEDIELAIETCRKVGNNDIALLKCTSSYPAPIEEANLIMIQDFSKLFNVIPGLSDHTIGATVPVVATALGAKIIEKHFILDRSIGGPDASFSMNEMEFTEMVQAVRNAEKAIGTVNYELTEKQASGKAFARSLYVAEDIQIGELFTEKNIRSVRPGFGLHPKFLPEILGTKATKNYSKGDRFSL